MTGIRAIIGKARRYGACRAADGIYTASDAISILLTAQGREFAMNTSFPGAMEFRGMKAELQDDGRVFIDSGETTCNRQDAVAVGDSVLDYIADRPDELYHIVVMHGAKVRIRASRYAVVTATNIGGEIIIENDGTALINIEQK